MSKLASKSLKIQRKMYPADKSISSKRKSTGRMKDSHRIKNMLLSGKMEAFVVLSPITLPGTNGSPNKRTSEVFRSSRRISIENIISRLRPRKGKREAILADFREKMKRNSLVIGLKKKNDMTECKQNSSSDTNEITNDSLELREEFSSNKNEVSKSSSLQGKFELRDFRIVLKRLPDDVTSFVRSNSDEPDDISTNSPRNLSEVRVTLDKMPVTDQSVTHCDSIHLSNRNGNYVLSQNFNSNESVVSSRENTSNALVPLSPTISSSGVVTSITTPLISSLSNSIQSENFLESQLSRELNLSNFPTSVCQTVGKNISSLPIGEFVPVVPQIGTLFSSSPLYIPVNLLYRPLTHTRGTQTSSSLLESKDASKSTSKEKSSHKSKKSPIGESKSSSSSQVSSITKHKLLRVESKDDQYRRKMRKKDDPRKSDKKKNSTKFSSDSSSIYDESKKSEKSRDERNSKKYSKSANEENKKKRDSKSNNPVEISVSFPCASEVSSSNISQKETTSVQVSSSSKISELTNTKKTTKPAFTSKFTIPKVSASSDSNSVTVTSQSVSNSGYSSSLTVTTAVQSSSSSIGKTLETISATKLSTVWNTLASVMSTSSTTISATKPLVACSSSSVDKTLPATSTTVRPAVVHTSPITPTTKSQVVITLPPRDPRIAKLSRTEITKTLTVTNLSSGMMMTVNTPISKIRVVPATQISTSEVAPESTKSPLKLPLPRFYQNVVQRPIATSSLKSGPKIHVPRFCKSLAIGDKPRFLRPRVTTSKPPGTVEKPAQSSWTNSKPLSVPSISQFDAYLPTGPMYSPLHTPSYSPYPGNRSSSVEVSSSGIGSLPSYTPSSFYKPSTPYYSPTDSISANICSVSSNPAFSPLSQSYT